MSDVATGVLVVCAVGVLAIMVHREFAPAPAAARAGAAPDHPVSDFPKLAASGHRLGATTAPVTIVEFADFECPVCRHFQTGALEPVQKIYGSQVAVVFRQWPLGYHRFAMPAARAAECAGRQGRFAQY